MLAFELYMIVIVLTTIDVFGKNYNQAIFFKGATMNTIKLKYTLISITVVWLIIDYILLILVDFQAIQVNSNYFYVRSYL